MQPLLLTLTSALEGGKLPGIDTLRLDSFDHISESRIGGNNFQLELAIALLRRDLSSIITIGWFDHTHAGAAPGVFPGQAATAVEYAAKGVNFGGGVRYEATDQAYFEGRLAEHRPGDGTPCDTLLSLEPDQVGHLHSRVSDYRWLFRK